MQIRYLPTETSLWSLYGGMSLFSAEFSTNQAVYYLRNRFTAFAVGPSGYRLNSKKVLESSSSLPFIFEHLVVKKRRKSKFIDKWTRVMKNNLYFRTPVHK